MAKEVIHSVTASDFDFTFTRGTGKGGQKRNKTASACHCKHRDSGSYAYSDKTRSQHKNKIDAWEKCINTPKFKAWHKIAIAKASGKFADLDKTVDKMMARETRLEYIVDGKWKEQ